MLAIICGHFLRQNPYTLQMPNMIFFSGFLRIAVNIFLLIGCWLMVDSEFSWKRIRRLYFTVAFYTVPITAIMIFVNPHISTREIIQGFVPFFGRAVWFATAYISLMILTPFLNPFFSLPHDRQRNLLLILLAVICIPSTIQSSYPEYVSDFLWFPCVYLFTGYVKRSEFFTGFNCKHTALFLGLAMYAAMTALERFGGSLSPIASGFLFNIRSFPNLLCAFAIFTYFVKLDIGSIPLINAIAKSSFAVYIVHQTPAFISYEWEHIWRISAWYDAHATVFYPLLALVVMGTYVAVSILDAIRNRLFEAMAAYGKRRGKHHETRL